MLTEKQKSEKGETSPSTVNQRKKDDPMQAIVRTKYGSPDVLQLKEIEKPTPEDDEALVKVHAASVNAADWHLLRGKPFLVRLAGYGLLKPKNKLLGSDIAGRVSFAGIMVYGIDG